MNLTGVFHSVFRRVSLLLKPKSRSFFQCQLGVRVLRLRACAAGLASRFGSRFRVSVLPFSRSRFRARCRCRRAPAFWGLGLGLRVLGFGFGVSGLGFGVRALGFPVWGFGLGVFALGFPPGVGVARGVLLPRGPFVQGESFVCRRA